jgi:type IV secretory pathway TrbF-like protein
MRIVSACRAGALLALTLALGGVLAASSKDVDAAMASGGLQKARVKGLELAYVRPGASLAAYQRVKIEPVDVSFDKSWNPNRTGSNIKISAEEREQIKSAVAKIVEEVFAKELQAKSTYQVVNEAGPDVLRVKASIVNLYINAPDADGFGRSKTFTSSAGSMTLMAELDDSASGQVLARVADRREASGIGRMQLTNGMVNEDELRTTAAGWARILRQALDKAHGIGAK